MSLDGAILVLGMLLFFNYWRTRSVLYPAFLYCCMWFLDLVMYRFNLDEFALPHTNTLNLITFAAVFFSSGAVMATLVPKALVNARFILTRLPPRNNLVKPAVVFFLACGIVIILRNMAAVAAVGTGATILQRSRSGGTEGSVDLGVGGVLGTYFMLWSLYAAPLFLLEKRDKKFWLVAFIAFFACILATARVPILILMSSLTCAHLMKTGKHRFWVALKFARLPIFLFLTLYISLIFVVKDLTFFEGSFYSIAVLFFVSYIIGPTAALDYSLQHPSEFVTTSNHTFKFFLAIAAHFHLLAYTEPPHDDFLFVPFPTNVYTVYRYYIADFGVYGTMLVFAIYGFFQTLLYRKARTGSFLGMYLFSATIYVILLSPFSDEYASFGAYIDMLGFAAIYIVLRSLSLRFMPRLEEGYGTRAGDGRDQSLRPTSL